MGPIHWVPFLFSFVRSFDNDGNKNNVAKKVQIPFPNETWNPRINRIIRALDVSPLINIKGKSINVPHKKAKINPTLARTYSECVHFPT